MVRAVTADGGTWTGHRVLIAGCGRIGTRLGLQLAANGARVTGLRRRDVPLPRPLQTVRADLTRSDTLDSVRAIAIDTAFYIATPGAFQDNAYRAAYVDGLRNLLACLAPDTRVVFVSSTAVYGQTDGQWVDETSATVPNAFSGQRMLEAEALLAAAPGIGTAVRFGGIYGAGRTRMLRKVLAGAPCVADPPQYTNRIHAEDAVAVLAHVAGLRDPASLYLGVDDAPCTQCELMSWLATRLGRPAPERISAPAGGVPGSNKRCLNHRLRASGYRFVFPTYREGYGTIIEAGEAQADPPA